MAASRNRLATDLSTRVGEFFASRLAPDEPLRLGLSGGRDSVVLLHALSRLGLASRLSALHVHHGLSAQADAWADFCQALCARLGVVCEVHRVDVDRQSALGLEAAAREARYRALFKKMTGSLVLAHHRDDQAETLLFNLLRGSGVTGAAGMPLEFWRRGVRVLRPLLTTTRAEIDAYARREGLSWVDDESNDDLAYSRNFVRHRVLPLVEARFPGAPAALAQAAAHFGEADALLVELACLDWAAARDDETARLDVLRTLSVPRLKNLLRYRLRQLGWRAPGASRLDEFVRQLLVAAPDRHPSLSLPDGCMRLSRGRLHWLAASSQ